MATIAADPSHAVDVMTYVAGITPGGCNAANTTVETLALLRQRNPETVWTGTPGVDKNVVWATPVPLAKVVATARATGCTVNDVLLTAVAGMLMTYLAERDERLDEVAWLLPVSLQPFGQGLPDELGNHFALVNFRMPLAIDDPAERVREIHRRTMRIKNSQETLITFGVQRAIAQSPQAMSVALTNLFANLTVGVLTNVPGPRGPVALAGTPVDAILGWAPSSGDQPMTICIYSYAGQVYLSLGVDATLIPDADRMTDLLEEEVDRLHRELVGTH